MKKEADSKKQSGIGSQGEMNEVDDLAQFFFYDDQFHWANELIFRVFRDQKIQIVKMMR